jgi:hypothetical protein
MNFESCSSKLFVVDIVNKTRFQNENGSHLPFICTEGRSRAPVAIGGRPPSKASAIDVCRQPALNENLHILKVFT